MAGLRLRARKPALDIAHPAQVGLIAHLYLKRSTPQVPPHPGGAHPWAVRGGARRD